MRWLRRLLRGARAVVCVWCVCLVLQWSMAGTYHTAPWPRHALVLTAHPDDECMFFGPIIQSLVQHHVTVSALCLSEGNADGLGSVRAHELTRSYGVLGVPPDRVTCLDDAALQDGMDVSWSAAYIQRLLAQYVHDHAVDVVITFDERGVSLHPNHRALYHGARLWAEAHPQRLWTLDTLTWRTKFAGPVSAVLQRWSGSDWVVLAPWRAYATSLAAMWQHRTQLVWFRYLYVVCSSYMQANRLTMVQGG